MAGQRDVQYSGRAMRTGVHERVGRTPLLVAVAPRLVRVPERVGALLPQLVREALRLVAVLLRGRLGGGELLDDEPVLGPRGFLPLAEEVDNLLGWSGGALATLRYKSQSIHTVVVLSLHLFELRRDVGPLHELVLVLCHHVHLCVDPIGGL
jgi:hypothetical protein